MRRDTPIATSITGASVSLTPLPLQRTNDIAIDTVRGSSSVASSIHAKGVTPAADGAIAGVGRSLLLGGGFDGCP